LFMIAVASVIEGSSATFATGRLGGGDRGRPAGSAIRPARRDCKCDRTSCCGWS
jgi:hypothetical protein